MAVAASTADMAFLLVDAARGLRPQTYRHLTVCALMGVRSIVVAINKMDLIGFEHATYEEFAGGLRAAAARLGIDGRHVIPVSAITGANVLTSAPTMPWYSGPTVLGRCRPGPADRGPTPGVRSACPCSTSRGRPATSAGYAGTIVSGSVARATRSVVERRARRPPSSGSSSANGDVEVAGAGEAVTLTLRPRGRRHPGRPALATAGATASTARAGHRVRRRPGLAWRGAAGARTLLPAAGRPAAVPAVGHRGPAPARRRLRRGDGRPRPEDERHRPRRIWRRTARSRSTTTSVPRHRRLPAHRPGQRRHGGRRPGPPRAAARPQRRAA